MRFLPTKVHGYLDYSVGMFLIAVPWLFRFAKGGVETWIFVVLGVAANIYSLITDYELGVVRKLSMPVHLTIDFISGVLLAASPWIFGFADDVYLPHLLLGLFEIGASLITKKEPSVKTTHGSLTT